MAVKIRLKRLGKIRRIPVASLDVVCRIGDSEPVTLGFIVEDYVRHMRHHLAQIAELRSQL